MAKKLLYKTLLLLFNQWSQDWQFSSGTIEPALEDPVNRTERERDGQKGRQRGRERERKRCGGREMWREADRVLERKREM